MCHISRHAQQSIAARTLIEIGLEHDFIERKFLSAHPLPSRRSRDTLQTSEAEKFLRCSTTTEPKLSDHQPSSDAENARETLLSQTETSIDYTSMREYYARLFREARRNVFVFWKAQIGVSVAAGIISAVMTYIKQRSPLDVALWSIGLAVGGYLLVLGVYSICALMTAPVNLDKQRKREFEQIEERLDSEVRERDSIISKHRDTIAEKDAALLRKHPADEHKEHVVREALADFSSGSRQFMVWLLARGEVSPHLLRFSGVHLEEINEAMSKGRMRSLIVDRHDKGVVFSKINEELRDALRNEFHSSDRPVTPNQA